MRNRVNTIVLAIILLFFFSMINAQSNSCVGQTPPCDGQGYVCPASEQCTQIDGECQCISAICPEPPIQVYMDAFYTNDNNEVNGQLDVELYYIEKDPDTGQGVETPLKGGLVIIDSGRYVLGSTTYTPNDKKKLANKACKAFSDQKGKIEITLPHPLGGTQRTHRIIFCPYVQSTEQAQKDMAICARLVDEKGDLHQTIDYTQIPDCDPSWNGQKLDDVVIGQNPKKIWNALAPAETSVTAINTRAAPGQVTFCWSAAVVFGLLLAASFTAGKNPLMFFDLNSARSIRMNRNAGVYQPMNQMLSINVEGAANTVYSAAKTAVAAGGKQAETNEDGNVVDEDGKEITTADGNPVTLNKDGKIVDSKGNEASNLSAKPAMMGTGARMNATYKGSRGGVRGELSGYARDAVGSTGTTQWLGSNLGSAWGNLANSTISSGLVNISIGALGALTGGSARAFGGKGSGFKIKDFRIRGSEIGKMFGDAGKSVLRSTALGATKLGIGEAFRLLSTEDYSDAGPTGASVKSPKEVLEELKDDVAEQLGVSADDLEVQKYQIWNANGLSATGGYGRTDTKYRIVGKKGSGLEKVRASFSQNGTFNMTDKSGAMWLSQAMFRDDGSLELSARTRFGQARFGSGGGYQIINGVVLRTGSGSGSGGFFEYMAAVVDSVGQLAFKEGTWKDVGMTLIQPEMPLVRTGKQIYRPHFRVENAHRNFKMEGSDYTVKGNKVFLNNADVGKYDPKNGNFTLDSQPDKIFRLSKTDVLDVTDENLGIQSFDGRRTKTFTLGGQTLTSQNNNGVQQIVDSEGNVLANIKRDREGEIISITDNSGKSIESITLGTRRYDISVGIVGRNTGGNAAIKISNVAKVTGASSEGWKGNFYDKNGEKLAGETLGEVYYNQMREALGFGNPQQTKIDAQRQMNMYMEHMQRELQKREEEQKPLEKSINKALGNPKNIGVKYQKTLNKLPEKARGLETDEYIKNASRYQDQFKPVVADLARIEAAKWLGNRKSLSKAEQNVGLHNAQTQGLTGKDTKIMNTKLDKNLNSQIDINLEIAKTYDDIATKIGAGYNVTKDLQKVQQLKVKANKLSKDGTIYSTASNALTNLDVKSYDLGTAGKKMRSKIKTFVKKHESGKLNTQDLAQMKFVLGGTNRIQNTKSEAEAKEIAASINSILDEGVQYPF